MTHDRETSPTPSRRPIKTSTSPGSDRLAGTPQARKRSSGHRLTLAPLIRGALDSAAERRLQRRRLVGTLILAQLLISLAVSVGYFGSNAPLPVLLALVAALFIYLAAFIANSLFHRPTTASYLLIIGGGAAITGQVVATALTGQPVDTAQAALFFLAIMLEAGLLLASEATLIIASTATCLTAVALLLSLALGPAVSRRDAYLVIVYTLSLQALVGMVSWLLAQFVSESVDEAQRAQELQFAQARFEALRAQVDEQRRQLLSAIATIQSAIARAFGGEYQARAELPDSELSDLAQSINELLRRTEASVRTEQEIERRDAALPPLMEALSRMAEPGIPGPTSLPLKTNTPMDNVSVAVSQSQANIAHRLAQVQKLTGEIAGAVSHSNDGLSTATEEVAEAQRLAGLLVSMADTILTTTQKQLDLIARTRRTLGGLLPEEIAQLTPELLSSLDPEEAARLRGLAIDLGLSITGVTDQFVQLQQPEAGSVPMPPLTRPLPAVGHEEITTPLTAAQAESILQESKSKSRAQVSAAHDISLDVPPEVIDAWELLRQIAEQVGQEERGLSSLSHELGLLSAAVRRVDTGIAWSIQALDTVRQGADQLQRVAGPASPPPDPGEPRPANPSRPVPPGGTPRIPQLSRPLSENTDTGGGDGTLAELAGETGLNEGPAPGSLRASDLINLDDLPGSGAGA
jgi:hypothetical protein